MRKYEKYLLLVLTIFFVPAMLFTSWTAIRAFNEESLFLNAPNFDLEPESRKNGAFGYLSGELHTSRLNPEEWPEVKNAIEYAVFKKKQDGAYWARDHTFAKIHKFVDGIQVGDSHIDLTRSTQYFLKMHTVERMINENEKYIIRWMAPEQQSVSAFGLYENGDLKGSRFERVIIVEAGTEKKWVAELAKGGRIKGYVLGLIALVLLVFTLTTGKLTVNNWQKAATA